MSISSDRFTQVLLYAIALPCIIHCDISSQNKLLEANWNFNEVLVHQSDVCVLTIEWYKLNPEIKKI